MKITIEFKTHTKWLVRPFHEIFLFPHYISVVFFVKLFEALAFFVKLRIRKRIGSNTVLVKMEIYFHSFSKNFVKATFLL